MEKWENRYLFIDVKIKYVASVCNTTVTDSKEGNVGYFVIMDKDYISKHPNNIKINLGIWNFIYCCVKQYCLKN
jgi:hypothetical protein